MIMMAGGYQDYCQCMYSETQACREQLQITVEPLITHTLGLPPRGINYGGFDCTIKATILKGELTSGTLALSNFVFWHLSVSNKINVKKKDNWAQSQLTKKQRSNQNTSTYPCARTTRVRPYNAVPTRFRTAGLPRHTRPVLGPNLTADGSASVPVWRQPSSRQGRVRVAALHSACSHRIPTFQLSGADRRDDERSTDSDWATPNTDPLPRIKISKFQTLPS